MKLVYEDHDDLAVLTVRGELTADHADEFRRAALERMDKSARDFIVDVTELEFVDSRGLEALLWLQDTVAEALGQIRLAGANENVEKILEMTRLNKRFERHVDVHDARKSLRI